MEGQLLPAHARVHAAIKTAMPNANTASTETRMLRRTRGVSRERMLSRGRRRAISGILGGCGVRFQRVTIGGYDGPPQHVASPRLRPGRHAGTGRTAARRAAHGL